MRTLITLALVAALGSGPALAQGGFLGISLNDGVAGQSGAVVASVETRSAASILGLQAGDRITRVDAVEVADSGALAALIGSRLPGEIVELHVVRGDQELDLLGVLGRRPGGAPVLRGEPRGSLPYGDGEWDFRFFHRPESDQGFPELGFDLPPMRFRGFEPEDFDAQMEALRREMEELRLRHEEMMRSLESRPRAEPRGDAEVSTKVHLRYPEATPEAERERLRVEAVAKYGPEAVVEFAGTGTSITIERTMTRGAAPPAEPGDAAREF